MPHMLVGCVALSVKEAHALSARHAAAHATGEVTAKGGERSPPVAAAAVWGGRNASSCDAEGWRRMSVTRRSRGRVFRVAMV